MPYFVMKGERRAQDAVEAFSFDFQMGEYPIVVQLFNMIVGKPDIINLSLVLTDTTTELQLIDKRVVEEVLEAQKKDQLAKALGSGGLIR